MDPKPDEIICDPACGTSGFLVAASEYLKENKKEEIESLTNEIEELNKVIEEFTILNKDNQKYIDDLNFDITNLKISVSSFEESESSINEIADIIEQDINLSKNNIANKTKQIEDIEINNSELKETILKYKEEIEKIDIIALDKFTVYKNGKIKIVLKNGVEIEEKI